MATRGFIEHLRGADAPHDIRDKLKADADREQRASHREAAESSRRLAEEFSARAREHDRLANAGRYQDRRGKIVRPAATAWGMRDGNNNQPCDSGTDTLNEALDD